MRKEEYLIHEAAQELQLEPHMLRYWEDELGFCVKRNERGYRIYGEKDMERLCYIKYLKEQGVKLKSMKNWMKDGVFPAEEQEMAFERIKNVPLVKTENELPKNIIPIRVMQDEKQRGNQMIEIKERKLTLKEQQEIATKMQENRVEQENLNEKAYKMQLIMQKILSNILEENNNKLIDKLSDNIKNEVMKEFDYQMRIFIEEEDKREEKRKAYEEEHYKKLDELLRQKMDKKRPEAEKKETKWMRILSNERQADF